MADALPDHRTSQAEGWRKVAVGDARDWKARAGKAEAERDRLRAENERLRQAIGEFLLATVGRRHLKNSDRELLSGALDEKGQADG